MTMRVSTTTIESFRLWADPEQDWFPEEELIATIRGEFTPKPEMLLGQAFGRCLERPERYRDGDNYRVRVRFGEEWPEFNFRHEVMAPALELFDRRGVF